MKIKQTLKKILKNLPLIKEYLSTQKHLLALNQQEIVELNNEKKRLIAEKEQLLAEKEGIGKYLTWVPPGHFYSPIPLVDEIQQRESEVFPDLSKRIPIPGVGMNELGQLELLSSFKPFYKEQPFSETKQDGLRYFFENPNYSYSDAIFLYCMIRHAQPGRIIEIGSGFSSCVTLDTNELFFNNSISCTFIEPYPELFYSLINGSDRERIQVIPEKLQDVPLEKFSELQANDILFIDSTHVSKTFSDVNLIFSQILPQLNSGVYIHFHDIFYPFEYPKDWVYEGRAWNEIYMLRAFLQFNHKFEIQLFNTFLESIHEDYFIKEMPLCLRNRGGSIWLKKL
jgi:hypothetical protein